MPVRSNILQLLCRLWALIAAITISVALCTLHSEGYSLSTIASGETAIGKKQYGHYVIPARSQHVNYVARKQADNHQHSLTGNGHDAILPYLYAPLSQQRYFLHLFSMYESSQMLSYIKRQILFPKHWFW
ncbi:MAG TPA: hypothetical protein VGD89_09765 [Flavipsychrobacter sp.]